MEIEIITFTFLNGNIGVKRFAGSQNVLNVLDSVKALKVALPFQWTSKCMGGGLVSEAKGSITVLPTHS